MRTAATILLLALIAAGESLTNSHSPQTDSIQSDSIQTDSPQKPDSSKHAPNYAPADYASTTRGGPHDFPELDRAAGSACSACHIPHVQQVRTTTTQPADLDPDDTEATIELFRIQGQRQTFEPGRYTPGATSLVCLGCHDGTVATSVIGSAHAMLAGVRDGFSVPDGFVWRDHPIGVPYPTGNREYRPLSFITSEGKVRLPEGRIECISCHDPHDSAAVPKMLVMSNRRSALCLTCHIK